MIPKSLFQLALSLTLFSLPLSSFAVGWVARHALSSAEYQDEFDKWTGQGLRLRCVSGYLNGAATEFAAMWDDLGGPSQSAIHDATAAQVASTDTTLGQSNFNPVWISVYPVGGSLRYAVIWEHGAAVRVIRTGRTHAQLQADKAQYEGTGHYLYHISSTTLGGTDYYAAIWQKSVVQPQQIWGARMNAQEYQTLFNSAGAAGYSLVNVFGCTVGAEENYTAIWRKIPSDYWWSYSSLSSANYQSETENAYYQGYRTGFVSAYSVNGPPSSTPSGDATVAGPHQISRSSIKASPTT